MTHKIRFDEIVEPDLSQPLVRETRETTAARLVEHPASKPEGLSDTESKEAPEAVFGREITETDMLVGSRLANPALASGLRFQTQSVHVEKAKLTSPEHMLLHDCRPFQSNPV
ncbi:hypothetical protein EYF80_035437 [Liparis tanakae]|uniref:Uncharacterized protein n=1 Tax=Liparis tanakae TaxID=230148 RepID=A0A4Z2GLE2_9TELE|nr:hypothetical protein EYF80_035437 [Liparis tanakae]